MDERIVELDNIVTEVKSSEEWEDVSMNIYEQGIARGIEEGIKALIEDYMEESFSRDKIIQKLQKHFSLSEEDAIAYYDEFTKEASLNK